MILWTRLDAKGYSDAERERTCEWLRANKFDPARVPWDALVEYDAETDEFVIDYYERPWRIVGDRPAMIRVRRRALKGVV